MPSTSIIAKSDVIYPCIGISMDRCFHILVPIFCWQGKTKRNWWYCSRNMPKLH